MSRPAIPVPPDSEWTFRSLFERRPWTLYLLEIFFRLFLVSTSSYLPAVFDFEIGYYFGEARHFGFSHLPYRDFQWEYPPGTTLFLGLVPLSRDNLNLFHTLFVFVTVLLEWNVLRVVRNFDRRNFWLITGFWTLVVVPQSLLVWSRMDYLSILCATVGLISVLRSQRARSVGWLTFGFLVKLWPITVAALYVVRRQWRELAVLLALCAVGIAGWYAFSPEGFRTFMDFRKGKGFQVESLPGSVLLWLNRPREFSYGTMVVSDPAVTWLNPVMTIATGVGVVALTAVAAVRKRCDDVLFVASIVLVVMVCSRLLSTQYIAWLAPFIALRLRSHPRLAVMYGILAALTYAYMLGYKPMVRGNEILRGVLLLRNAVLVVFVVSVIRAAFKPVSATEQGTAQAVAV